MSRQARHTHWFRLWRCCVTRRWQMVVDLRGSLISWFLPAASRRIFVSGKRHGSGPHVVEILSRFIGHPKPVAPYIKIAPSFGVYARKKIPDKPATIAIGPTAGSPEKQWQAANFITLIDRLTGAGGLFPNANIAVFSGAKERGDIESIIRAIPPRRFIDCAGTLTLPQTYACLSRCNVYIGNDSGPMHMAAAAGIPTLGLFGPSDEKRYHPWGPRGASVRGSPPCGATATMEDLTVDQVEQAARRLLAKMAHQETSQGQPHRINTPP